MSLTLRNDYSKRCLKRHTNFGNFCSYIGALLGGLDEVASDLPGKLAIRAINEAKGVNRCVFDIASKPPGTIEWE